MKTQLQFIQADGDQGIALLEGSITTLEQAKRELANQLNLPDADTARTNEDLNARLREGGIDPNSISFSPVAE